MNKTSRWIFYTLGVLLVTFFANNAVAHDRSTRTHKRTASNAQVRQAMHNAVLAESVVASRESATGRPFDPAYRASLKNTLASLPAARLESLQNAGGGGSLGLDAVGDSSTSLIYTPITPCRVFDTRYSTAGILAGDTQRNFFVAGPGTTSFTNQGGTSGGCGIPFGPATSVMINFAAVAPTGAGNLRAWAVANPQPVAPLAAVMNFSTDMPVLANGVAVPICDDATTSCAAGDLRLQADVSSVHIVGDVVGYFQKLDLPTAMPMGSDWISDFAIASSATFSDQYEYSTVDVVLPHDGSCLVTCNVDTGSGGAEISTGWVEVFTARLDVATATDDFDDSHGNDIPVPAQYVSTSATYTWNMTGGRTYRFGCNLYYDATEGGGGDFIGKWARASISWVCR